MKSATVNISDIDEGTRYRKQLGDLSSIMASLSSEHGMLNPITLIEQDGKLTLAAGYRRLQAAKMLKWQHVPARIYEGGTDLDLRCIELIENEQREDPVWHDRIALRAEIDRLQKEKFGEKRQGQRTGDGWSTSDTAKLIGVSKQQISEDLSLHDAVKILPDLKKCQSAADATKMLKKLTTECREEKLAEERASKLDTSQKKLCDSYVTGDFFDFAPDIPSESVQFIDLDPPWGVGYERLVDGWSEDWDDWSEQEYKEKFPVVCKHCYRILDRRGWMVVWFATKHLEMTADILEDTGFKFWRVPAIWTKNPGACRQPKVQLRNCYETFFYVHKGDASMVKLSAPNLFHFPQSSSKVHPTEKPVALMKQLLTIFCREGSRVLIPFAGSGNTFLAAHQLKMSPFGYDKTKRYKNGFVLRVTGKEK